MPERQDQFFDSARSVVDLLGGDFATLGPDVTRDVINKVTEIQILIGVARDPLAISTWRVFSELPASTPYSYLASWRDYKVPSWSAYMEQLSHSEKQLITNLIHFIQRVHSPQTIAEFSSLSADDLLMKNMLTKDKAMGLKDKSINFYRTAFQGEDVEE